MAAFEDGSEAVLEQLRQFFVELDRWVPILGDFLEMISEWPEARHGRLFDLSDIYTEAVQLYTAHLAELNGYLRDLDGWQGESANAARRRFMEYTKDIADMAATLTEMQTSVHGKALEIGSMKWMAVVNLVMLAMVLVQLIITSVTGIGVLIGAGEIAMTRAAISALVKSLLARLWQQNIKGGVKAMRAAGLRGVGATAVRGGAMFAGFIAGANGGIMFIQHLEGRDPFVQGSGGRLFMQTADGFIAGAIGGPLMFGIQGRLSEALAFGTGQAINNMMQIGRDKLIDRAGMRAWAERNGLYSGMTWKNVAEGLTFAALAGEMATEFERRQGPRSTIVADTVRDLGLRDMFRDRSSTRDDDEQTATMLAPPELLPDVPVSITDPAEGSSAGGGGKWHFEPGVTAGPGNGSGDTGLDTVRDRDGDGDDDDILLLARPKFDLGSVAGSEAGAGAGAVGTIVVSDADPGRSGRPGIGVGDGVPPIQDRGGAFTGNDGPKPPGDGGGGGRPPAAGPPAAGPPSFDGPRSGNHAGGNTEPGGTGADGRTPDGGATTGGTAGPATPPPAANAEPTAATIDAAPPPTNQASSGGEKRSFGEWLRSGLVDRFAADYTRSVAEWFAAIPQGAGRPSRSDVVRFMTESPADPLDASGRRLKEFVEKHFVVEDADGRRPMDDQAITAKLRELGAEPRASADPGPNGDSATEDPSAGGTPSRATPGEAASSVSESRSGAEVADADGEPAALIRSDDGKGGPYRLPVYQSGLRPWESDDAYAATVAEAHRAATELADRVRDAVVAARRRNPLTRLFPKSGTALARRSEGMPHQAVALVLPDGRVFTSTEGKGKHHGIVQAALASVERRYRDVIHGRCPESHVLSAAAEVLTREFAAGDDPPTHAETQDRVRAMLSGAVIVNRVVSTDQSVHGEEQHSCSSCDGMLFNLGIMPPYVRTAIAQASIDVERRLIALFSRRDELGPLFAALQSEDPDCVIVGIHGGTHKGRFLASIGGEWFGALQLNRILEWIGVENPSLVLPKEVAFICFGAAKPGLESSWMVARAMRSGVEVIASAEEVVLTSRNRIFDGEVTGRGGWFRSDSEGRVSAMASEDVDRSFGLAPAPPLKVGLPSRQHGYDCRLKALEDPGLPGKTVNEDRSYGLYGFFVGMAYHVDADNMTRFLLVRDGDRWDVPRGWLNSLESPTQALARYLTAQAGAADPDVEQMRLAGQRVRQFVLGQRPYADASVLVRADSMYVPSADGESVPGTRWVTRSELEQLEAADNLCSGTMNSIREASDLRMDPVIEAFPAVVVPPDVAVELDMRDGWVSDAAGVRFDGRSISMQGVLAGRFTPGDALVVAGDRPNVMKRLQAGPGDVHVGLAIVDGRIEHVWGHNGLEMLALLVDDLASRGVDLTGRVTYPTDTDHLVGHEPDGDAGEEMVRALDDAVGSLAAAIGTDHPTLRGVERGSDLRVRLLPRGAEPVEVNLGPVLRSLPPHALAPGWRAAEGARPPVEALLDIVLSDAVAARGPASPVSTSATGAGDGSRSGWRVADPGQFDTDRPVVVPPRFAEPPNDLPVPEVTVVDEGRTRQVVLPDAMVLAAAARAPGAVDELLALVEQERGEAANADPPMRLQLVAQIGIDADLAWVLESSRSPGEPVGSAARVVGVRTRSLPPFRLVNESNRDSVVPLEQEQRDALAIERDGRFEDGRPLNGRYLLVTDAHGYVSYAMRAEPGAAPGSILGEAPVFAAVEVEAEDGRFRLIEDSDPERLVQLREVLAEQGHDTTDARLKTFNPPTAASEARSQRVFAAAFAELVRPGAIDGVRRIERLDGVTVRAYTDSGAAVDVDMSNVVAGMALPRSPTVVDEGRMARQTAAWAREKIDRAVADADASSPGGTPGEPGRSADGGTSDRGVVDTGNEPDTLIRPDDGSGDPYQLPVTQVDLSRGSGEHVFDSAVRAAHEAAARLATEARNATRAARAENPARVGDPPPVDATAVVLRDGTLVASTGGSGELHEIVKDVWSAGGNHSGGARHEPSSEAYALSRAAEVVQARIAATDSTLTPAELRDQVREALSAAAVVTYEIDLLGSDGARERSSCPHCDSMLADMKVLPPYLRDILVQALIDPKRGLVVLFSKNDPLRENVDRLRSLDPRARINAMHGGWIAGKFYVGTGEQLMKLQDGYWVLETVGEWVPSLRRPVEFEICCSAATSGGAGNDMFILRRAQQAGVVSIGANGLVAVRSTGELRVIAEVDPPGAADYGPLFPRTGFDDERPGWIGVAPDGGVVDLTSRELSYMVRPAPARPLTVGMPPQPHSYDLWFEAVRDPGDADASARGPRFNFHGHVRAVISHVDHEDRSTRYLMVRDGSSGEWGLPGGYLQRTESPHQGLARYLADATGATEYFLNSLQHVGMLVSRETIGSTPWAEAIIAVRAPNLFHPAVDGTDAVEARWLTADEMRQLAGIDQDLSLFQPSVTEAFPAVVAPADVAVEITVLDGLMSDAAGQRFDGALISMDGVLAYQLCADGRLLVAADQPNVFSRFPADAKVVGRGRMIVPDGRVNHLDGVDGPVALARVVAWFESHGVDLSGRVEYPVGREQSDDDATAMRALDDAVDSLALAIGLGHPVLRGVERGPELRVRLLLHGGELIDVDLAPVMRSLPSHVFSSARPSAAERSPIEELLDIVLTDALTGRGPVPPAPPARPVSLLVLRSAVVERVVATGRPWTVEARGDVVVVRPERGPSLAFRLAQEGPATDPAAAVPVAGDDMVEMIVSADTLADEGRRELYVDTVLAMHAEEVRHHASPVLSALRQRLDPHRVDLDALGPDGNGGRLSRADERDVARLRVLAAAFAAAPPGRRAFIGRDLVELTARMFKPEGARGAHRQRELVGEHVPGLEDLLARLRPFRSDESRAPWRVADPDRFGADRGVVASSRPPALTDEVPSVFSQKSDDGRTRAIHLPDALVLAATARIPASVDLLLALVERERSAHPSMQLALIARLGLDASLAQRLVRTRPPGAEGPPVIVIGSEIPSLPPRRLTGDDSVRVSPEERERLAVQWAGWQARTSSGERLDGWYMFETAAADATMYAMPEARRGELGALPGSIVVDRLTSASGWLYADNGRPRLLVDDDPDRLLQLRELLSRQGIDTTDLYLAGHDAPTLASRARAERVLRTAVGDLMRTGAIDGVRRVERVDRATIRVYNDTGRALDVDVSNVAASLAAPRVQAHVDEGWMARQAENWLREKVVHAVAGTGAPPPSAPDASAWELDLPLDPDALRSFVAAMHRWVGAGLVPRELYLKIDAELDRLRGRFGFARLGMLDGARLFDQAVAREQGRPNRHRLEGLVRDWLATPDGFSHRGVRWTATDRTPPDPDTLRSLLEQVQSWLRPSVTERELYTRIERTLDGCRDRPGFSDLTVHDAVRLADAARAAEWGRPNLHDLERFLGAWLATPEGRAFHYQRIAAAEAARVGSEQ